ncbi:MAG: hypothetical protein KBT70_00135 [Roseovarius sp.]|uniref:hypothetical protein n=1 Tax=Roseovarius sp. TaxID=1486281 RepID=UPI001B5DC057|nr:hypothetical protein [Roseovarius sp.]MBQ0748578.1 hypothetical protein [Roseovarius sp.]
MDAKTKRAFARATKALTELAKVAAQDPEAFRRAVHLLLRGAGGILGAGLAMSNAEIDDLHENISLAAKQIERSAIDGYSGYLAAERAQSKRDH